MAICIQWFLIMIHFVLICGFLSDLHRVFLTWNFNNYKCVHYLSLGIIWFVLILYLSDFLGRDWKLCIPPIHPDSTTCTVWYRSRSKLKLLNHHLVAPMGFFGWQGNEHHAVAFNLCFHVGMTFLTLFFWRTLSKICNRVNFFYFNHTLDHVTSQQVKD